MHYVIPVVIEWPSTVVAVNVGSAVIPGFLSFYLLVKNRLWVRGILATAGVAEVCHLLARPIPWPWNRTSRVRAAYIGGGRRAAAVAPAGRAGAIALKWDERFESVFLQRRVCKLSVPERGLEGIVSKRANGRYEPDRRTWLKVKCLNREEFVVVGWSDPEGSRHRIGALLLGYYTPDGKLIYSGRAGTGMPEAELERLWQRLQPLVIDKMPLAIPPPRGSRFGSPLVLSRVHWVRPEMVVEVSYVEWTPDGLLRHVVYLGERQDKLATEVRRTPPHAGEA
jgi:hypothetical protein